MDDKLLKKADRILGEKEIVKLDFTNSEHEEYFFEIHGGKELIKDKYKALYNAYKKTKERHMKKKEKTPRMLVANVAVTKGAEGSGEVYNVSAGVGIPEIVEGKETGKAVIQNDAHIYVNPSIKYIAMDGAMINPGTRYCYGVFWNEYEYKDIVQNDYACQDIIKQNFNKSSIQDVSTQCNFEYIDKTGNVDVVIRKSEATYEQGAALAIEKIEITAPRSYKSPPNNPVKVTYKGRSWQGFDYDYPDNDPVSGQIKTRMPIEGYIIFNNDYKPVELSDRKSAAPIELIYQEELSVGYGYKLNEIKNFFKIDANNPQRVNFKFNDDWRVSLPSETYGHLLTTILSCPLFYKTKKNEQVNHIPFCISSVKGLEAGEYYISNNSYNVYIPPIELIWGCFGKNTMIEMADQSQKLISEIMPGEKVAIHNGEPVEVLQLVTGTEETMVHIKTEDEKEILLTDTHPVMTKRGIVRAKDINITDEMVLQNDATTKIRYLYAEEYNDIIYNLDLGGSHMIIANGYITGDMDMQNKQEEKIKEAEKLSPEVENIIEEMKMLRKELAGTVK